MQDALSCEPKDSWKKLSLGGFRLIKVLMSSAEAKVGYIYERPSGSNEIGLVYIHENENPPWPRFASLFDFSNGPDL